MSASFLGYVNGILVKFAYAIDTEISTMYTEIKYIPHIITL